MSENDGGGGGGGDVKMEVFSDSITMNGLSEKGVPPPEGEENVDDTPGVHTRC